MIMKSKATILGWIVPFYLIMIICSIALSQPPGQVKIAVWGDSRENKDNATEGIINILLNEISDWDFTIHTGDFTHKGRDEDWQRSLNIKGMKQLFVSGKFLLCTSNHDEGQAEWDKYTAGILPINNADSTTHYYAIQKENVHVIFLDSMYSDFDKMQMWLDQYLINVKKEEWLIGVWHIPCYDRLTYKKGIFDMCEPWLKSLYRHGGDFVVHGHAHVYLRTKPLSSEGAVDLENGMVHIINGTGGATWKKAQNYTEKTAFTPNTTSFPCIVFLTIKGNIAKIQTVDARPNSKLAIIDEWIWAR